MFLKYERKDLHKKVLSKGRKGRRNEKMYINPAEEAKRKIAQRDSILKKNKKKNPPETKSKKSGMVGSTKL